MAKQNVNLNRAPNQEDAIALMEITQKIRPLLEAPARSIAKNYLSELLSRSNSFIVEAVWGTSADGALTATQYEIHKVIQKPVQEVLVSLNLKGATRPQKHALEFLVREILIWKLAYLIELGRGEIAAEGNSTAQGDSYGLEGLDPIGEA